MDLKEVGALLTQLRVQKVRWLGTNHPDSRIRKLAFESSGIEIGKDVFISIGMVILDDYQNIVKIGNRCAFGNYVSIVAASRPNNSILSHHPELIDGPIKTAPILFGKDCWIGTGSIVLPGITIGEMDR